MVNNIFKKNFIQDDNLISFYVDNIVTKKVNDFYNEAPFPHYGDYDDKSSINLKGDKNLLARDFKNYIGLNKDVLEVGCGTGQLSIYFGIGTNNRVYALDPTMASINLGRNFAKINKINNIKFINADIFNDIFNDEVFDFIWTSGVLHHTKNPCLAFNIISKSLKKNGYILVGLYNRFGRIRTKFRQILYKIFGRSVVMFLDPTLRNLKKNNHLQINSWIRDQYEHPVESLHTLDEVLNWFKKNNIDFISSIPSCSFDNYGETNLFKKKSKGNFFTRLISQISMIFNNLGTDGGLFIVIGKKNEK